MFMFLCRFRFLPFKMHFAWQWRHNQHDCVSNYPCLDGLLNRLLKPRSKETSKLRVTGLCEGNSPVTGEISAWSASNAENVSVCWRHHSNVQLPPWPGEAIEITVELSMSWNKMTLTCNHCNVLLVIFLRVMSFIEHILSSQCRNHWFLLNWKWKWLVSLPCCHKSMSSLSS